MAEKKFFVDINLQGSALTNAKIGTNSGIGSTEGAFGYDSSAHRLQYFDGTVTKEVANLSDIAAVTGGLIFQGGYDASTNTPDITDGTASRGFFWVVTTPGSFLGDSVQIGDSLIAKGDGAGTTLADWIILQGNVVIATDSVDGISRLATQTEANDGTEGGAVVITPATLQGKIDAQITPEINSKVSKSGDTMSGELSMGGNNITNVQDIEASQVKTYDLTSLDNTNISVNNNLSFGNSSLPINLPAPTNGSDAANKTYVDDNTSNKLPLAGGTMSGDINMDNNGIENVNTLLLSNFGAIQVTEAGSLSLNNNKITDLAAPTLDGDATNKLYVDNASNDKLPLAGGTMSGTIDMNGEELLAASISNSALTTNLNANDNKITSLLAPTDGGDATNKTYVDAQDALKLSLTGGTMTGSVDMGGNNIDGVSNINANNVNATFLASGTFFPVGVSSDLDFGNTKKITNITAPTNGGDATNKTYVDGVGATAESNANAYTDTAISAQKYSGFFANSSWTFSELDGVYSLEVTHNLGSNANTVSVLNNTSSHEVEFAVMKPTSNTIILESNIEPTFEVLVTVIK